MAKIETELPSGLGGSVKKTSELINDGEFGNSRYIEENEFVEAIAEIELLPGPQGPAGPKGADGAPGVKGDKGDKGSTGLQGQVGPRGSQGPTGPAGPKGDRGLQGVQGLKGNTGPQGVQGLQGAIGPVGPTGLQGATGPQGPIGLTGSIGPQGVKGDTGTIGPQGIKGDKGDTGSQGAQGIQGPKGEKGDIGPQGIKGDKGDQGIPGEQGADGTGVNILGSFDSPLELPSTGNTAGDAYLIEGDLWVWSDNSNSWVNAGNIQGPKGDKGDKGDAGATGSQGIQGVPGETGPQGIQGIQGLKGDKGDKGDVGNTGQQGLKGDKGDKGDQGLIGLTGATGATGPAGPQGEEGVPGPQGPQGIQGVPGSDANANNGQLTFSVFTDHFTNASFTFTANQSTNTTATQLRLNQGIVDKISQGATAYSWGNHSNAGYLKIADLNGYATQTWVTSITGNKSNLTTTNKNNLVEAINEINDYLFSLNQQYHYNFNYLELINQHLYVGSHVSFGSVSTDTNGTSTNWYDAHKKNEGAVYTKSTQLNNVNANNYRKIYLCPVTKANMRVVLSVNGQYNNNPTGGGNYVKEYSFHGHSSGFYSKSVRVLSANGNTKEYYKLDDDLFVEDGRVYTKIHGTVFNSNNDFRVTAEIYPYYESYAEEWNLDVSSSLFPSETTQTIDVEKDLNDYALKDGSNTIGGTWSIGVMLSPNMTSVIGNGQVIYADGGVIYIGNPNLPAFNIETTNTEINHYRGGSSGYLWSTHNFNPAQYVLQSSLTTQLGNYVPINGVTTINNTKTFTSSPVVPNGTLNGHAVNLGQLNSAISSITPQNFKLKTDNPNDIATTGSSTVNLVTHVYDGLQEAQIGAHGNALFDIIDDATVKLYASYDQVYTQIESVSGFDFYPENIRAHVYNIIFQGTGNKTLSFADGVYAGDQLNITVSPGASLDVAYMNGNIISSAPVTAGNYIKVKSFANLIWDADQGTWVLTSYGNA